MRKIAVALLAAILCTGAAWSVAGAQDQDQDQNQGQHRHHHHWNNGQCYAPPRDRDDRGDRDDQNGGNYNNGGYYNYNNNNNNNGRYNPNNQYNGDCGQYGGQYNGQYGGQYNGPYGGQYGRGNSVLRGTIVGVNGNQVTLRAQNNYGPTITINDQPALNNQTSGRVAVGRYVNAYGYWQNGIFYATQMN
jgi:hypothetical protein